MVDEPLKTVYIIGSGFSVGVGGPLLYDLLSDRGRAEMLARFPALEPCEYVYNVFWRHQRGNKKADGHEILWSHAEEFLDYVNTTAWTTGARTSVLENILRDVSVASFKSIADFARLAAFAVAAECSFARDQNPLRESWEPYVDWSRGLQKQDVVVTFNYDTVLENIGGFPSRRLAVNLGKKSIVHPFETNTYEGTPVYKLHGSTQWSVGGTKDHPSYGFDLDLETVFKRDWEPLIGMPGPSKRDHCFRHFESLWEDAMIRLTGADVVVFMGYRFPPSDSYARTKLLGALKANKNHYLRIHTVLGPDLNHENSVRLIKLLELTLKSAGRDTVDRPTWRSDNSTAPSFDVIPQPLYAEDYMSVIGDDELYGLDVNGPIRRGLRTSKP